LPLPSRLILIGLSFGRSSLRVALSLQFLGRNAAGEKDR
jgi:hypothetical protein